MAQGHSVATRTLHWVSLACAALATLLGVGTIVGWQLSVGPPALLPFVPALPALQGLVGAAFAAAGLALLALQAGWKRLAGITGSALTLAAMILFFEDALELDLGLDAAMFERLAASRSVAWIVIPPVTLLAFVLAGTALVALALADGDTFVGTSLATLVTTLGVTSMVEAVDATDTISWLDYFNTPGPTAMGLMIVGGGMLAAGFDRKDPETRPADWAAPLAVGITAALIGVLLWQGLRGRELSQFERLLERRSQTFSFTVRSSLSEIVEYLSIFPYQPPPEPTGQDAPPATRQLAANLPGLLSTTWIDLPGSPAAASPEQALAGVSELAFLDGNYDALVQAEGPLLSGPVPLDEDDTAFRLAMRRRLDAETSVYVTGLVSAARFFGSLDDLGGSDFDVLVLRNGEPVYRYGEVQRDSDAPPWRRAIPLEMPGPATWEMVVMPRLELLDANRSALPEVVLGASLLIAVLLTALTHTAQVARHRAWMLDTGGVTWNAEAETPTPRDVVAAIEHEIRNPLAAIQNVVEILEMDAADHDQERMQAILHRQVRVLADVMNALRDLQVGSGLIEMHDVELNRLVGRVVEEMRGGSRMDEGTLVVRLTDSPIAVKGGGGALRRALRYLVGHALTYTPRGGTVRVEVEEHGSVAHVTIRDRGPAPGTEEIQRIFLPFSLEREMAGRRRASGTITLAASRKIIEIHGGEISATSETDHGVTFRITLPRA